MSTQEKSIRVIFFNIKSFEKDFFQKAASLSKFEETPFDFVFLADELNKNTAPFSKGFDAVCISAQDHVTDEIVKILAESGVKLIALRSAGYNNIELSEQTKTLPIVHIPSYSPYSTAEFAVAMLQALNRKIYKAYNRTRDENFDITGLVGTEIHGKTVGIIGAGKIGKIAADIFKGFGAKVLLNSLHQNPVLGQEQNADYVNIEEIFKNSEYIFLFCPLTQETRHIINSKCISLMKKDVLIVNTGRTALIDTAAILSALTSDRIKGLAMDIFEEDTKNLFDDWSASPIQDENTEKLLKLKNVLVTNHQGYLTEENLNLIAKTTLESIVAILNGEPCEQLLEIK